MINIKNKQNEIIKILFLGLDGTGKSTIITKLRDFKNEEVVEIFPTPFMNVVNIKYESKSISLIEVSGQMRYRNYWQMFYENMQGIIFIIDGADMKRIKIVKEQIEKLEKDLPNKIPIAFLINKQDIEGALNKNDIQDFIDLDRIDSNFIWTIKNCIGYTGLGTKEALNFILENITNYS